jgi:DNA-directed RNA polymerase subunit beta'
LLSFKNLKRQVWLNFSEKNKHLLSFLNRTEELDFLSRFLQTNLLLHQNKKTFHFFEIQQILQNSQNNFVQYLNILLNKITTVFFKISYGQGLTKYLTTNQKEFKIFSMEKQQVSYPKKPHNSECFPFSKKTVALNSFQNYKNSKVHQLMFQRLSKEKKIHPFLKFQPADSFQYVVYLKNLSTIKKKLSDLKNKTKHSSLTLFNNIYTVAYSNGWQTEKDWRYFLYYNTASVEMQDQRSSFYKHRFISESFSGYSFSTAIPILGANLTQKLLFQYEGIELKKMAKQHQNLLPKLNRYIRYIKQVAEKKSEFLQVQKLLQKRDQIIRRLKLLRKLFKKNVKPSAAVLNTLPVLPPDLRPILKMQNQIAASDFNRFYQRILYRNERLKKFLRANASMVNYEPGFELKYAQRLLQEAVDNLIQNGKGQVKPETNSRGQPLKSLSEILKGKQGRFRQYLLGKRIDYSGRSVIVVGPNLKISQCGLPFEMAIELFLPFLIKRIFQYKLARTVIGAKTILKTQKRITWNLLEEIMQNHPILLNRAPTLHRLGIQAFQAKLIEGRAILLHPLVCPAFNADFDGDQMAVHVPITVEARTEAWKLMSSRNHLISPATGEPMLLPSQDMILGCYYLTTELLQISTFHKGRPFFVGTRFYFLNMQQVLLAYQQQKIHLQTPIWIKWNGSIEMEHHFSQPLEIRLNSEGSWIELRPKVQKHITREGVCDTFFVRTTAGRVLFNSIIESCVQNL